jgi:NADPH-dependent ferric siderophore reductase
MPNTITSQFRFFALRTLRSQWLGPAMVRVTFGGPDLDEFLGGGRDQRITLFLPHPHQRHPVLPATAGSDWFHRWQAMNPQLRAVPRTYTVREHRLNPDELDVDFAGPGAGPASRWAANTRPGDRVVALGPVTPDNTGVGFRPEFDPDWVLLAGDESALPAIEAILRWLPTELPTRVFVQTAQAADIRPLTRSGRPEVTWLIRDNGADLCAAVRAARLPTGRGYAWVAGEAGASRRIHRHLREERGLPGAAVSVGEYWRLGYDEDELMTIR